MGAFAVSRLQFAAEIGNWAKHKILPRTQKRAKFDSCLCWSEKIDDFEKPQIQGQFSSSRYLLNSEDKPKLLKSRVQFPRVCGYLGDKGWLGERALNTDSER